MLVLVREVIYLDVYCGDFVEVFKFEFSGLGLELVVSTFLPFNGFFQKCAFVEELFHAGSGVGGKGKAGGTGEGSCTVIRFNHIILYNIFFSFSPQIYSYFILHGKYNISTSIQSK